MRPVYAVILYSIQYHNQLFIDTELSVYRIYFNEYDNISPYHNFIKSVAILCGISYGQKTVYTGLNANVSGWPS